VAVVTINLVHPPQFSAETAASSSGASSTGTQWSVQVVKVDAGDVALAPSFQIAIYESLLEELSKTKRFKQVLRDGDRNAADVSDLLILKTTVRSTPQGARLNER
jgi:hypothetical protein